MSSSEPSARQAASAAVSGSIDDAARATRDRERSAARALRARERVLERVRRGDALVGGGEQRRHADRERRLGIALEPRVGELEPVLHRLLAGAALDLVADHAEQGRRRRGRAAEVARDVPERERRIAIVRILAQAIEEQP